MKQEKLFGFSFICIFPLELYIYSFQLLNPVALSYCQVALEDGQNFLVQQCLQLFYNSLRNCIFQLRTSFKIHLSFVEKSLYIHDLFVFTVLQIKEFLLRRNLPGFGEICVRSLQDHNQLNAPFPVSFSGPLQVSLDVGTTLLFCQKSQCFL